MTTQPSIGAGLCGISIDVDSVVSHLRGYGVTGVVDHDVHLRFAIPRSIELFSRYGVKATYFLIAEEAKRHPEIVKSIVEAGHEVASHSLTHLLPFHPSEPEIFGSKRILEELTGESIRGFRAPSWDYGSELYTMLSAAGYRYDASAFPSWMMLLYRLSVKKRAVGDAKKVSMPPLSELFGPPAPYEITRTDGGRFIELPVSTAIGLRVPWYHTMNHLLPRPVFEMVQRLTLARRAPVQYVLHAVDFLGLVEDDIDRRLAVHPGMGESLPEKFARIERVLQAVTAVRRGVTLAEIAENRH
jgi:peptidoglycan/xylan/chitin deacetylase (PgdA/CDA1 family)